MKLLITGGLGHIGSHVLENINKISICDNEASSLQPDQLGPGDAGQSQ